MKKTPPLSYLASPYAKFPMGAEHAYVDICTIAGSLIQSGVMVYCPIAHCHPIARYSGIDLHNYELWMPLDKMMLDRCDNLIVAHMPTWETSKGIAEEVKYFSATKKPIFDLSIKTLCMVRRTDPNTFDGSQLMMGEW